MTVTELHGSVADMLGVRSKAWIGAPLLVILSVLVALSIAESFVRLAGIGSDQFLRSDRVLGVRFIPGKRGLSQGICYGAHVSINSHGWRGREVSVSKPPGVYRILVLGDSFMAGLQVENGQTFPSVLEDILTRLNPSQRVEVLNFGVPSWGTDQEYVSLREYGLSFDPNLVLLAFYAQNDVSDNSAELQGTFSAYPKPFFDIEGDRLIERPFEDPAVGPLAVARRLAAPLRLYPLVRDSLLGVPITHRLLYDMGIVGVPPAEEPPVGGQTHNVFRWPERWRNQLGVYRRDYSAAWTRAWDITRRLTLRIRDDAKASGSDFLLVQVPGPVSVMPASLRRDLVPDDDQLEMLDVDRPHRELEQFTRRENINFVSLTQSFRDRISDSEASFGSYYLSCDGHWTPAGHQLAAELVASEAAARIVEATNKGPARADSHHRTYETGARTD